MFPLLPEVLSMFVPIVENSLSTVWTILTGNDNGFEITQRSMAIGTEYSKLPFGFSSKEHENSKCNNGRQRHWKA
jgi:hypothetical protein